MKLRRRILLIPMLLVAGLALSACGGEFSVDLSDVTAEALVSGDLSGASISGEVEFVGTVEAIGADAWTVDGQTLLITAQTEIKGSPAPGDLVKVHASIDADGTLTALELEPAESAMQSDTGDESHDEGSKVEFYGTVETIGADA